MHGISMKSVTVVLFGALLFMSIGCGPQARRGGVIGGAAGGAVGAAIGARYGSTVEGALIGAAVGGAAGALIGRYMDQQAEQIRRDVEGVNVERVAEGIRVTFDGGLLFDFDSAELRQVSRQNLQRFAQILQDYPNTNILIEGHTDSTGPAEYNQGLSERRARSVSNYLASIGVSSGRFVVVGYGESQPTASNATPEGRQLNRRVEVGIMANEQLQQSARDAAAAGRREL